MGGKLVVARETTGLEIFSWNGFLLENVTFSEPKLFVGTDTAHQTAVVFLGERGSRENKENKEKEGKSPSVSQKEAPVLMMFTQDAEVLLQ